VPLYEVASGAGEGISGSSGGRDTSLLFILDMRGCRILALVLVALGYVVLSGLRLL
jgi:hypothetical protein